MTSITRIIIKSFAIVFAAIGCGLQIHYISEIYFGYETVNQIYIGPANDVTPPSIVLCSAISNWSEREPLDARPNNTIADFKDSIRSCSEYSNSSDLLTQLIVKSNGDHAFHFSPDKIRYFLKTHILLKDEGTLCVIFNVLLINTIDTSVYSHCEDKEYLGVRVSKPQLAHWMEW